MPSRISNLYEFCQSVAAGVGDAIVAEIEHRDSGVPLQSLAERGNVLGIIEEVYEQIDIRRTRARKEEEEEEKAQIVVGEVLEDD